MKITDGLLKGMAAAAALGLLLTLGFDASAQDSSKKAPAAKAPAKATAKAPSACKGLDEAACKAKEAQCQWIAATKTKAGKERKAYCRSRPVKKK
jgi:hypothetical protein